MPKEVTLKKLPKSRAVVPPQTQDLTPNTPLVADSAPYWTRDEQYILFHSDRADLQGTTKGTATHVYRMRPDGSGVEALTGPLSSPVIGSTTSQSEPTTNPGGSAVVYIDSSGAGNVDLMELNLATRTARSLLKSSPNAPAFTGLNHPEYGFAPGGNIGVIFAGQVGAGQPFHLYTVDTQSGNVTQLTSGAADDRNPTLSPDPDRQVIAFDSNRTNAAGTGTGATRDIWVIGVNPNIQNATRVTNFSAGGKASSNIQPAWSTNKVDQPNGDTHIVNGQQLLAFASTRYDTANDGNANGINPNGTHDVYWLKVTIAIDPNNGSVYTVTTPESPTNAAYKLVTSDPQHKYDDLHPSWPQFIATYSVAYQSDRTFYNAGANDSGPAGQPTDIFSSTLMDLNSPLLLRADEVTGDVVRVEPRLTSPGSPVKITVRLADLETGIRDVWFQIKNPNSKYQSADNKEHKVFFNVGLALDTSNTVPAPVEYEMQRIFIGNDPSDARVNTYADPRYIASIDDFFAYAGSSHPPDASWLQATLVSRDPATGIGTYSATWKTDVYPTDYMIDVIAYDNAVNPFSTSSADKAVNWKIYDNVWGFSTKVFQAAHNILFVSDYSAGQKFFASRFGIDTIVNVQNTFWGTESWMTDIDLAKLPNSYINGTTVGSLVNVLNTLGPKSYGAIWDPDVWTQLNYDPLALDGTRVDSTDVPATQQYDMWRIQCRGPVTADILAQYAPRMESQPPDTINGETTPRQVRVAPRCVIWNAPYAGGMFAGAGTITDLETQTLLHSYLASGGRLLMSGQDIAWALTLGGATLNGFLSGDLHAAYANDSPAFTYFRISAAVLIAAPVSPAYQLTATGGTDPITHDPWVYPKILPSTTHSYPGPPFPPGTIDFISNEANYLFAGLVNNPRQLECPGDIYPDVVTGLAGTVTDMTYGGGGTAILHYQDNTTGQKVVYAPMGLEGLYPDFFTPPNTQNTLALKNRRAELVHNAVCWMRTGGVTGTVRDIEAGAPMEGVLVRLSNQAGANGAPIIAYTGMTGADGTFRINGVEPGDYEISAIKPGFTISKRTFVTTHGGFRDDTTFRMTKAEPSVIKGKVTRLDGTTPIAGATVTATDITNPALKYSATTDANGNYVIDRVPSQTRYTLTASAPGYGASIPLSYTVEDPNDPSGQKLLQPAKVYEPYDFKLKAQPGSVSGFVFAKDAQGNKGAPIAGATVTATSGSTTVTAITDANGAYSFADTNTTPNGLDPGTWSLVASAPGYAPNNPAVSVTVVSNQNTVAPDILLGTVPPGSISGLVTRSSDGSALPGVLIQLTDATGNVIASTTTTSAKNNGTYTYNYIINNVPAGTSFTVTATRNGFTANPTSRTATITSGQETRNVNFVMEPLHTFAAQLSLISTPYDYSGFDPVNDVTGQGGLLDIPQSDAQNGIFQMATWDLGHYVFYPTPPANTFHIGRGYFLGYKQNMPLSVQGTPADTTRPFNYPLNSGWNLIGDPFLFDIDWTKVHFIDGPNTWTYSQAVANGAVGSALYSYLSGSYVLSFRLQPWVGYWVRAYRNVTLVINPQTDGIGRAVAIPNSRAVLGDGTGYGVNLRLQIADTRDDDNYFGISTRAVDGFDGHKVEKPPAYGKRYSYLSFTHPEWGDRAGSYGVDVRSASTAKKTWDFTVDTTVAKANATITWPNVAAAPRGTTFTITDLATGQSRDMRTTSGYSWATGDQPTSRKFRIEAARTSADIFRITDVAVRSMGRGSAAGISFNLSQSANVEIRILGSTGTQVRRLSGRATRAAGINQLTWDQKNDQNVAVPSGSYTVEIRAQSQDGKTTVRQIAPFTVIR